MAHTSKDIYSEEDTKVKFIDPKLKESDWTEDLITREYYFTDGRKLVGNKRGERLFADYLLKYRNKTLAIIEAKKYGEGATKGLQQVIKYGEKLKLKVVFSTDGKGFYQYDLLEGKGEHIQRFPSPEELYRKYVKREDTVTEQLLSQPFQFTSGKKPRYYQEIAVNEALDAVSKGNKRVLLTLATGTGKTYIALQIVHKLFETKWNIDSADRRPKILFLADRNILADQAINEFNFYEKDLIKVTGEEVRRRNGKVPTNANIFFAIYQAIAENPEFEGYYKAYPKNFFDLVIIDECHRGSANETGSWRDILDYFDTAVHLGLTATPKRKDNVDTYRYFGKPVYEYSLKDGINDGFLTPYKVKRIRTNIDEYIYTSDDTVVSGEIEEKKVYELKDFNRTVVIPKREELIAKAILDNINEMDKTIVFCQDQDHASLIRDSINVFKKVRDPHYCVRVTSDEGEDGKKLLEAFRDNEKDIPVILTTSQMLTTGVDARNVRNIVILRNINYVVEFKQIVGRGTRVFEGKDFFTILDFMGATNHFYDEEWDGLPDEELEIDENKNVTKKDRDKKQEEEIIEPVYNLDEFGLLEDGNRREKAVVELSDGRKLAIIDIETRYIDEDGKPLSAKEFIEKLIGCIPIMFKSEKQLRELWSKPETREDVLKMLQDKGFDMEQLDFLRGLFNASDCDIFDVLAYISFNKGMLKRKERTDHVRGDKKFFEIYENIKARDFLMFILDRYEKDGIEELKRDRLGELVKMDKLKTTKEAGKAFGNMDKLIQAYYDLQENLYKG